MAWATSSGVCEDFGNTLTDALPTARYDGDFSREISQHSLAILKPVPAAYQHKSVSAVLNNLQADHCTAGAGGHFTG
jgi:hypothetical protein